jgi:hypothetical protein
MVEKTIDPVRPPTINQSIEELEAMQAMIDAGQLPADFIERHFDAVNANVFGVDAPKDRHGNRTEQGKGSPANMTRQSIDAFKRWHGPSKENPLGAPNYEKDLAKMEAQLAANEKKNPTDARDRWLQHRARKAVINV